ncbi:MAG: hypothetical protein AAF600_19755 [Bacteroidota bacterium]
MVPLGFSDNNPRLSKGYVSKLVIEKNQDGELEMFVVKATGNAHEVESGEFNLGS